MGFHYFHFSLYIGCSISRLKAASHGLVKHLRLNWFIEGLMESRPNLSKSRTEEAVDEEVGGRVDDQEDVGDKPKEDDPDGETTKNGAATELDLFQD